MNHARCHKNQQLTADGTNSGVLTVTVVNPALDSRGVQIEGNEVLSGDKHKPHGESLSKLLLNASVSPLNALSKNIIWTLPSYSIPSKTPRSPDLQES